MHSASHRPRFRRVCVVVSLVAACAAPLAGCAGGVDLNAATSVDDIRTGSISGAAVTDATRASDEATIRNAVSVADLEAARTQPPAWANADTGSRGTITDLAETTENGMRCRRFTASRESFDGVALYNGTACRGRDGAWHMTAFRPL